MNKKEKLNRVIARGEISNHCHVVTGDADVKHNEAGEILIEVGKEGAVLKHLLESEWMAGKEVWTKEHTDIHLQEGSYKYVPQIEYDPYNEVIQQVRD